jgi:hypothetical protein
MQISELRLKLLTDEDRDKLRGVARDNTILDITYVPTYDYTHSIEYSDGVNEKRLRFETR